MASILHHETNSPGCYCCPIARQPASASTSSVALDASLHELGMLSAVTDSRRDYLLEKLSRDHSGQLCVLAMNSAYIADFSFVAASSPPSETVPLLTLRRPRVRALRRRQYFYQPYDYPWRQRLMEMLRTKQVPPCDGSNKSNPGSPSKLAAGAAIVRSKSLDDLEAACGTKADIVETVSREIGNLHFS
uniref:Uncharacterized protein n=1 Tax=Rhipicephalus zambeziensis TaxID=60191 RepID=A0A224YAC9_9ACAR